MSPGPPRLPVGRSAPARSRRCADPWPVRYGIRHGDNGPVLQLTPDTLGERTSGSRAADLRRAGFALDVEQAIARPGSPLRRLRSDLIEHTFTGEQQP